MIQCPLCFIEIGKEVEMEVEASFFPAKNTIEIWAMCPECLIEYEGSLR